MDFIVKLLFLGGKYISQAAGRTIIEIYHRSKEFGRHMSVQYEKASEIIKPYDNMLELLHDRAKETSEDDKHIADLNEKLKRQLEEHLKEMPKIKSEQINKLVKTDSLRKNERSKRVGDDHDDAVTSMENCIENSFVTGDFEYDKMYSDLCKDLSNVSVGPLKFGNSLGQDAKNIAFNTSDLKKTDIGATFQNFTESNDETPPVVLDDLEKKINDANLEIFDFNTEKNRDTEREIRDFSLEYLRKMQKIDGGNPLSSLYGNDATYMKYLVQQSPSNSYFNANAISDDAGQTSGMFSSSKEQSRSMNVQETRRSRSNLQDADEIIRTNNKNTIRGLHREIETRMGLLNENKEHFKRFERRLHDSIIKNKIKQIACDVEVRSSVLAANVNQYNKLENNLEKKLKRSINKMVIKRTLSLGKIANSKSDLIEDMKTFIDLLKINEREFQKLERKVTQRLLRRGLDNPSYMKMNYKEINKLICKSCLSSVDREEIREREKILQINKKVFDKFEKDMRNVVVLKKNLGVDKQHKLISEGLAKYHVETQNLFSDNVYGDDRTKSVGMNCLGAKEKVYRQVLKCNTSNVNKEDIRQRTKILEANAKAFETFESNIKKLISSEANLPISRPLTSAGDSGGSRKRSENRKKTLHKNIVETRDGELDAEKVIKNLKEVLDKSTIFKPRKSGARKSKNLNDSKKIDSNITDFVKIKKVEVNKDDNKSIPRYTSPTKKESDTGPKMGSIRMMNQKLEDPKDQGRNNTKENSIRKKLDASTQHGNHNNDSAKFDKNANSEDGHYSKDRHEGGESKPAYLTSLKRINKSLTEYKGKNIKSAVVVADDRSFSGRRNKGVVAAGGKQKDVLVLEQGDDKRNANKATTNDDLNTKEAPKKEKISVQPPQTLLDVKDSDSKGTRKEDTDKTTIVTVDHQSFHDWKSKHVMKVDEKQNNVWTDKQEGKGSQNHKRNTKEDAKTRNISIQTPQGFAGVENDTQQFDGKGVCKEKGIKTATVAVDHQSFYDWKSKNVMKVDEKQNNVWTDKQADKGSQNHKRNTKEDAKTRNISIQTPQGFAGVENDTQQFDGKGVCKEKGIKTATVAVDHQSFYDWKSKHVMKVDEKQHNVWMDKQEGKGSQNHKRNTKEDAKTRNISIQIPQGFAGVENDTQQFDGKGVCKEKGIKTAIVAVDHQSLHDWKSKHVMKVDEKQNNVLMDKQDGKVLQNHSQNIKEDVKTRIISRQTPQSFAGVENDTQHFDGKGKSIKTVSVAVDDQFSNAQKNKHVVRTHEKQINVLAVEQEERASRNDSPNIKEESKKISTQPPHNVVSAKKLKEKPDLETTQDFHIGRIPRFDQRKLNSENVISKIVEENEEISLESERKQIKKKRSFSASDNFSSTQNRRSPHNLENKSIDVKKDPPINQNISTCKEVPLEKRSPTFKTSRSEDEPPEMSLNRKKFPAPSEINQAQTRSEPIKNKGTNEGRFKSQSTGCLDDFHSNFRSPERENRKKTYDISTNPFRNDLANKTSRFDRHQFDSDYRLKPTAFKLKPSKIPSLFGNKKVDGNADKDDVNPDDEGSSLKSSPKSGRNENVSNVMRAVAPMRDSEAKRRSGMFENKIGKDTSVKCDKPKIPQTNLSNVESTGSPNEINKDELRKAPRSELDQKITTKLAKMVEESKKFTDANQAKIINASHHILRVLEDIDKEMKSPKDALKIDQGSNHATSCFPKQSKGHEDNEVQDPVDKGGSKNYSASSRDMLRSKSKRKMKHARDAESSIDAGVEVDNHDLLASMPKKVPESDKSVGDMKTSKIKNIQGEERNRNKINSIFRKIGNPSRSSTEKEIQESDTKKSVGNQKFYDQFHSPKVESGTVSKNGDSERNKVEATKTRNQEDVRMKSDLGSRSVSEGENPNYEIKGASERYDRKRKKATESPSEASQRSNDVFKFPKNQDVYNTIHESKQAVRDAKISSEVTKSSKEITTKSSNQIGSCPVETKQSERVDNFNRNQFDSKKVLARGDSLNKPLRQSEDASEDIKTKSKQDSQSFDETSQRIINTSFSDESNRKILKYLYEQKTAKDNSGKISAKISANFLMKLSESKRDFGREKMPESLSTSTSTNIQGIANRNKNDQKEDTPTTNPPPKDGQSKTENGIVKDAGGGRSGDASNVGKFRLRKIIAFVPEDVPAYETLRNAYEKNMGNKECFDGSELKSPSQKKADKLIEDGHTKEVGNLTSTKPEGDPSKTVSKMEGEEVSGVRMKRKFSFVPLPQSSLDEIHRFRNSDSKASKENDDQSKKEDTKSLIPSKEDRREMEVEGVDINCKKIENVKVDVSIDTTQASTESSCGTLKEFPQKNADSDGTMKIVTQGNQTRNQNVFTPWASRNEKIQTRSETQQEKPSNVEVSRTARPISRTQDEEITNTVGTKRVQTTSRVREEKFPTIEVSKSVQSKSQKQNENIPNVEVTKPIGTICQTQEEKFPSIEASQPISPKQAQEIPTVDVSKQAQTITDSSKLEKEFMEDNPIYTFHANTGKATRKAKTRLINEPPLKDIPSYGNKLPLNDAETPPVKLVGTTPKETIPSNIAATSDKTTTQGNPEENPTPNDKPQPNIFPSLRHAKFSFIPLKKTKYIEPDEVDCIKADWEKKLVHKNKLPVQNTEMASKGSGENPNDQTNQNINTKSSIPLKSVEISPRPTTEISPVDSNKRKTSHQLDGEAKHQQVPIQDVTKIDKEIDLTRKTEDNRTRAQILLEELRREVSKHEETNSMLGITPLKGNQICTDKNVTRTHQLDGKQNLGRENQFLDQNPTMSTTGSIDDGTKSDSFVKDGPKRRKISFRDTQFSFIPLKKLDYDDPEVVSEMIDTEAKPEPELEEKEEDEVTEKDRHLFPEGMSPLLRYFMRKKIAAKRISEDAEKDFHSTDQNHQNTSSETQKEVSTNAAEISEPKTEQNIYTKYPFLLKYKNNNKYKNRIPRGAFEWKMKFIQQAKAKRFATANEYPDVSKSVSQSSSLKFSTFQGTVYDDTSIVNLSSIPVPKYSHLLKKIVFQDEGPIHNRQLPQQRVYDDKESSIRESKQFSFKMKEINNSVNKPVRVTFLNDYK